MAIKIKIQNYKSQLNIRQYHKLWGKIDLNICVMGIIVINKIDHALKRSCMELNCVNYLFYLHLPEKVLNKLNITQKWLSFVTKPRSS